MATMAAILKVDHTAILKVDHTILTIKYGTFFNIYDTCKLSLKEMLKIQ